MRPPMLILLLALTFPLAAADEAHPDCEPGQPNHAGLEMARLCDGEHWDGQEAEGTTHAGVDAPPVVELAVAACTQGCGALTLGVYYRDHTPGNVIATTTNGFRITQDAVQEGDCDYATHESGRRGLLNSNGACYVDNRAFTLTVLP